MSNTELLMKPWKLDYETAMRSLDLKCSLRGCIALQHYVTWLAVFFVFSQPAGRKKLIWFPQQHFPHCGESLSLHHCLSQLRAIQQQLHSEPWYRRPSPAAICWIPWLIKEKESVEKCLNCSNIVWLLRTGQYSSHLWPTLVATTPYFIHLSLLASFSFCWNLGPYILYLYIYTLTSR